MKQLLLLVAAAAVPITAMAQQSAATTSSPTLLSQFRPIGASGNNLRHPAWNPTPGTPELAITPLNFASGTHNGLISGPNPRIISNTISGGTGLNGTNAQTTDPIASAWLYVFGQFLDHDLDLEDAPPTTADISITIPAGDPVFKAGTTIVMNRDLRSASTNTIINTTAGYLDLSQLYGSTVAVASSLRNTDGTLRSSDQGQALPVTNDQFVTGDPRVMENPELSAVTTLFMREHNYWASRLKTIHPGWNGDQVYSMAKEITTGEYQNIIYKEYLPVLIGAKLGSYGGYNPNASAQVTQEFSTAAFRVGHSQVSDTLEGLDNAGNVTFTESLSQAFFNTASMDITDGIDPLLRGVTADSSQATDVYAVAVLRNLLFAPLASGDVDEMDLIAIDIQRQRDVGLGTLNETRQALGLTPYTSFAQVTRDSVLQANLQSVYGTVDKLDLFMGGLAENHAAGARVGPTFQAIIARQFQALRAGDRFFWQNEGFDSATAAMISNTTLGTIIARDTDSTSVPRSVFVVGSSRSTPHSDAPGRVSTNGRTFISN